MAAGNWAVWTTKIWHSAAGQGNLAQETRQNGPRKLWHSAAGQGNLAARNWTGWTKRESSGKHFWHLLLTKILFMFLHLELRVTRFLMETWFELAQNVTTGCLANLLAMDAV